MNCQDFERIINDLARDRMMEATARSGGLAHAEMCKPCAARLADERALSEGLRSLAASVQDAQAPARVEAALLSAFRGRDKLAPSSPTVQPRPLNVRHQWRWATGIAAAMALLFGAFAVTRIQQKQQRSTLQLVSAHASQPLKMAADVPTQDQPSPRPVPGVLARRGVDYQAASLRTLSRDRNSMASNNRARERSADLPPVAATATNTTGVGEDIATDFIPLTYESGLDGMDSGQMVRVELPRTAMAQFGLPVNAERASEPVKADVLLGEDGLARAIRFVR